MTAPSVQVLLGDCREVMAGMEAESVDSIVTDPPYELAFMGKSWDAAGVAFESATWEACLRVLKPGGHLLAFGGTRTSHRMVCAIEDAGFEIRDTLLWLYGSGFPKSLDAGKAIDKAAGARREVMGPSDRHGGGINRVYGAGMGDGTVPMATVPATPEAERWDGWGTTLKPAYEPIVLGRKPLAATVAANLLQHSTGALNIDGCRIHTAGSEGSDYTVKRLKPGATLNKTGGNWRPEEGVDYHGKTKAGRWPANAILDEEAAGLLDEQSGTLTSGYVAAGQLRKASLGLGGYGNGFPDSMSREGTYGDSGGASRFFYTAKASQSERGKGNTHPTVKPLALMRWLVRLVTPPRGVLCDPFAGSGTTLMAALQEGFQVIGIEQDQAYVDMIHKRLSGVTLPLALEEDAS